MYVYIYLESTVEITCNVCENVLFLFLNCPW